MLPIGIQQNVLDQYLMLPTNADNAVHITGKGSQQKHSTF